MAYEGSVAQKMDNRIKKRLGNQRLIVTHSFAPVVNGDYVDVLDNVIVSGDVILRIKDYYSSVMSDPTWLDVCVFANQAQTARKDEHHVFVESVDRTSEVKNGIVVYSVFMGS